MARARGRGLASWQPRAKSLALLQQVNSVLDEYRDHLPLTIRQIFYRLVGAHAYDKTEQAYDRLGETLNRACRAGPLQWRVRQKNMRKAYFRAKRISSGYECVTASRRESWSLKKYTIYGAN